MFLNGSYTVRKTITEAEEEVLAVIEAIHIV